jgi:hypothetical protein
VKSRRALVGEKLAARLAEWEELSRKLAGAAS